MADESPQQWLDPSLHASNSTSRAASLVLDRRDSPVGAKANAGETSTLKEPAASATATAEVPTRKPKRVRFSDVVRYEDSETEAERQQQATTRFAEGDTMGDVTMDDAQDANEPSDTAAAAPAISNHPLYAITASNTARTGKPKHTDPFVVCRLIAVTVILSRREKEKEAQALGQYTIDLIGTELWKEHLPVYVEAAPEPELIDPVPSLLDDVVQELKQRDSTNAGFLNILMGLIC